MLNTIIIDLTEFLNRGIRDGEDAIDSKAIVNIIQKVQKELRLSNERVVELLKPYLSNSEYENYTYDHGIETILSILSSKTKIKNIVSNIFDNDNLTMGDVTKPINEIGKIISKLDKDNKRKHIDQLKKIISKYHNVMLHYYTKDTVKGCELFILYLESDIIKFDSWINFLNAVDKFIKNMTEEEEPMEL